MDTLENIQQYGEEHGLSYRDSLQTFMQVIVLKNLSHPEARLIGGSALVLGFGNPRFSEDVDLTQVENPSTLERDLGKAVRELREWFGVPILLAPPKAGHPRWRIICSFSRWESARLHVDSQIYPSHSRHSIILRYSGLPPFACESITVEEIMAEKLLALAFRRYLGGRDLFDLWFHWLSRPDLATISEKVTQFLQKKLKDRQVKRGELMTRLRGRVGGKASLDRARMEWKRYLPQSFQKPSIEEEILEKCRILPDILPS